MNILIQILLWVFLAAEAVGVLVALSEAKKPRADLEPAGACLGAGLIMVCAAPVALLLMTDQPDLTKYLAAWLALGLAYDLAQFVRQAHGVRGPRTPVSTTVTALWGLANMAVVGYILLAGV